MTESTAISEELVVRFFAALEAGDVGTLREIYAPDAVIWHNDDLIERLLLLTVNGVAAGCRTPADAS